MHIHPAGMDAPHFVLLLAAGGHGGAGVVLLQAYIANSEPVGAQGPQQLVAVVLQCLQPGARRGAHGEQAAVQPQRATVGRQLGAGNARPGLPQGCQVSASLPALLQLPQAAGQGTGRRPGRWHQQAQIAELASLLP